MIHQYINNDIPIVLGVNSGSVHVVDQLVYDAIARMDEGKSLDETIDELKSTYGPDEIREAWEECQTSCQSACKTSCTVGNQTCEQK